MVSSKLDTRFNYDEILIGTNDNYDYLSFWNLVSRQMSVYFRLPLIIIVFSRQLGIEFSQVTAFHILCTMGNLAANNVLLIIGIFSKKTWILRPKVNIIDDLPAWVWKLVFTSAVIFQWLYMTWHINYLSVLIPTSANFNLWKRFLFESF